jgi:hypothetical protein
MLFHSVNGKIAVDISADAARLLVYIPANSRFEIHDKKLVAGGVPVDYRYKME